jgi:uncharacterized membrane protein YccC
MAVAVTGAIVLGDQLSGRRFYWAVIAAFVTFMGANNAGEQLRKGIYRVAGTVIGVLIGAVLAHVVGRRTDLAIAVILGSLFVGLYLMRISYAFMVIGVTVMVSQLYVQLDEFSNSLLVLRLEETALGAGVAALTVLCVLPLRTQRVARVATRQYLLAVTTAVELAIKNLGAVASGGDLRNAARTVDAAYHEVLSTVVPLRLPFTAVGDSQRLQFLHSVSASRHYVRTLLTDTAERTTDCPTAQDEGELATATEVLVRSLQELVKAFQGPDVGSRRYTRSAALFGKISVGIGTDTNLASRQRLALRDLQLLDGALAVLAETTGLAVHALDIPDSNYLRYQPGSTG